MFLGLVSGRPIPDEERLARMICLATNIYDGRNWERYLPAARAILAKYYLEERSLVIGGGGLLG